VSAAVGLANLDLFEREDLNQHVLDNEGAFRSTLEKLYDLPIVGDVRGDGFFYGIELVKDKATKETFDATRSRSGCCAASSPRPCSRTACTAAPTTAATRSSSWPRR
jgi:adenosylmethionine-8-amino-7-oxononanoate aminotransferase